MKRAFLLAALIVGVSFGGCQKQQTEEERRAEVEREVQQRLATERQQQLDQREADLKAREQSLNENTRQSAAAQTRETARTNETETAEETSTGGQPTGSYSIFYTKLEPYGDWVETSDYGYVYRPREAGDARWRPYTNGRWVYTDAGWTWISNESFGWATYHYGRWTRIRGIGWVWVPGNEWAPAWVSWRKGGEYVGWAPLPPEARFDRRRGIQNWSDSYYDVGPNQYVFVPVQQFGEERIERAIVPEQRALTIVNETTNVTNITYNNTVVVNQGPGYDELKRQSRIPIPRMRIERQASVATNEPRAIFRGDVVELPAPVITAARPAERPRVVKQKIAQTPVDLGWAAINPREAEQTRAKMKAEATPPPDAPPKSGPPINHQTISAPSATTATPATTTVQPATTPVSPGTGATGQKDLPARSHSRPVATTSPQLSATPISPSAPQGTPVISPRTERPVSLPPSPPISPMPTSTPPDQREITPESAASSLTGTAGAPKSSISQPDPRRKLKSAARQFEKQSTVPMPSASVTPGAGPSDAESTASSPEPRRIQPRGVSAQPEMTASAVPAAAPNTSGAPPNARRDREKRKNPAGGAERSPAGSPSITPTP